MGRFRDRSTPDLVVAFLAAIVGMVVLMSAGGAIALKIHDPSADLGDLMVRIADITNTLIGAVVGYLAGRGVDAQAEVRNYGQHVRPPSTAVDRPVDEQ